MYIVTTLDDIHSKEQEISAKLACSNLQNKSLPDDLKKDLLQYSRMIWAYNADALVTENQKPYINIYNKNPSSDKAFVTEFEQEKKDVLAYIDFFQRPGAHSRKKNRQNNFFSGREEKPHDEHKGSEIALSKSGNN